MREQKGNMQLVIIIIILAGIVGAVALMQQKTNFLPKAAPSNLYTSQSTSSPTIQNDSNLTKTLTDLDNTDLNTIDTPLNQNDIDSSNF